MSVLSFYSTLKYPYQIVKKLNLIIGLFYFLYKSWLIDGNLNQ